MTGLHSAQRLRRVLYVEDESDIRELVEFALVILGNLEVRSFSSGSEAIAAAGDFVPQLCLLDVMMPGMDGPTTLAALRSIPGLAKVPAIFMTAKMKPDERASYQEMGVFDVIPKPFDPMTLVATLDSIWQKWLNAD